MTELYSPPIFLYFFKQTKVRFHDVTLKLDSDIIFWRAETLKSRITREKTRKFLVGEKQTILYSRFNMISIKI